jgi:hypothetical protein
LPRGGIASALYNVERSLIDLSFSFFITKQMKTDPQGPDWRHLADPLRVPGAWADRRSVSPISLDDQAGVFRRRECRRMPCAACADVCRQRRS